MTPKLLIGLLLLAYAIDSDWKLMDLGRFSLEVPDNWEYKPAAGIDSFVGSIIGPNVDLEFDCSRSGYVNPLIETPEEYAASASRHFSIVFMKPGVVYTSGDVAAQKKLQEKSVRKRDRAKVRVEAAIVPEKKIYKPSAEDLKKYKDADFMVELRHKDSVVVMPITLSPEHKKHHISVDTVQNVLVKLIWPKTPGDGMTGVYMRQIGGRSDLNIVGNNLNLIDQEIALKAFRTIKLK
jgi:hypothetical protein